MVYRVTRIDLPDCDWNAAHRANAPRETLPCFVAGPENRLAVPVMERLLAGKASSAMSPLVLAGSTGTGKSFLVRGIVRRWSELHGEEAIGYFTAADFGRELRAARNENNLHTFRQQLSELKLLVVEDIHRLAESAFVQRELRDTLDVLSEAGNAVVLTSQESPGTLAHLESGLRDRLSGGLTIRLRPPGPEAREELLELAAHARGTRLDAGKIQSLAHKITGPAPQLFRALAQQELHPDAAGPHSQSIEFKQIVALVARYFSLTQAALRSSARRKSLVYARGIAIYLARSLTDLSYAQIGKDLGGRDHTTIMNALQKTENLLSTDVPTQQTLEELRRILTAA